VEFIPALNSDLRDKHKLVGVSHFTCQPVFLS